MNKINQKQNEYKILKFLFSQRFIYKKCKKISKLILIISLISFILGLIPCEYEIFENIKLIISSGLVIIVFIGEGIICNKNRELAVDYQEYIDRSLFEFKIDKKTIPNLNKLDNKANEIIIANRNEFQKLIDCNNEYGLYNWYSDVSNLPLDIARIVCQNENIRWESRQRNLYSKILIFIIFIIVIVTIIKINIFNESYLNILTSVPLILDFINIIYKNNVVVKSIYEIEDIILNIYINIETKGKKYNKTKIKQQSLEVQNKIREYRLNDVSIPEFIYNKLKIKEQKKSSEFIGLKVDEISNHIL